MENENEIKVDRTKCPTYPKKFVKKVTHPELELIGPTEYDLNDLELWLIYDQKSSVVRGDAIYHCLRNDNVLDSCLGFADLLAIQDKGIAVFRKLFAGKEVFAWKSVVQSTWGHLSVPYLHELNGKLFLYWLPLHCYLDSNKPALRFSFKMNKKMEEKTEIQEVPKKIHLKVQSQKERNQRLRAWQKLIEKLPYCDVNKNLDGLTENSGYVNDNDQLFGTSVFIASLSVNLDYHEFAYYILYFCFVADGTFKIHSDNNLFNNECSDLNDPTVKLLQGFGEKNGSYSFLTRDIWFDGYQIVCEILEKTYGNNKILKPPKP